MYAYITIRTSFAQFSDCLYFSGLMTLRTYNSYLHKKYADCREPNEEIMMSQNRQQDSYVKLIS